MSNPYIDIIKATQTVSKETLDITIVSLKSVTPLSFEYKGLEIEEDEISITDDLQKKIDRLEVEDGDKVLLLVTNNFQSFILVDKVVS